MTKIANSPLAESERKLTMLLMEVRNTATFERVKLYVSKFTGRTLLSEYLADDNVPAKERAALANALIEILLTRDYSRLPELKPMENGNAPKPSGALVPEDARQPGPKIDTATDGAESPSAEELREIIRAEVRRELANIFEIAARVLREKP